MVSRGETNRVLRGVYDIRNSQQIYTIYVTWIFFLSHVQRFDSEETYDGVIGIIFDPIPFFYIYVVIFLIFSYIDIHS